MKVIARSRRGGKTHALIQWVKQGEQTDSYPGWSRVIVTHTITDAQRLREEGELDYRQVFSVQEWRTARLGRKPVEVAVDNADLVLATYLGQTPHQITITGSAE